MKPKGGFEGDSVTIVGENLYGLTSKNNVENVEVMIGEVECKIEEETIMEIGEGTTTTSFECILDKITGKDDGSHEVIFEIL